MQTDRLVHALVDDLVPVEPLAPTGIRLVRWLAGGIVSVAIVVLAMGLRTDVAAKFLDAAFVGQELSMLATGVVAGWAALAVGVPGSARCARYVPWAPLLFWMASMAYQYVQDRTGGNLAGPALGLDLECIPGIAITGLVPIVTMIAMIRSGNPQFRGVAVFWGTLASAALANAGLRLFHPVDAAIMVIVWQFGTVIAFTALATLSRNILVPIPRAVPVEP